MSLQMSHAAPCMHIHMYIWETVCTIELYYTLELVFADGIALSDLVVLPATDK